MGQSQSRQRLSSSSETLPSLQSDNHAAHENDRFGLFWRCLTGLFGGRCRKRKRDRDDSATDTLQHRNKAGMQSIIF